MSDARSQATEDTEEVVPQGLSLVHGAAPARRRDGARLALAPRAVDIAVAELRSEPIVRFRPLDMGHVTALAEVPDRWPPIVVAAEGMVVLDGVHRVAAAKRLGMTSITAQLFEGSEDTAFIEAVRANVQHGLPLTLPERRWAARRLLTSREECSDRAIGEICGLDHKTVARLRHEIRHTLPGPRSEVRLGRDRRARPVDAVGLRTRIADALAEAPTDSLRQIARRVGASPETVRDVRARLARGDDPVPPGARSADPVSITPPPGSASWPPWTRDTACRSESDAAEFAAWFDRGRGIVDWQRFVDVVPLSRVYEIADQARAYAGAWQEFAEALERRTRSRAAASPSA